jgi:hypothetical protein
MKIAHKYLLADNMFINQFYLGLHNRAPSHVALGKIFNACLKSESICEQNGHPASRSAPNAALIQCADTPWQTLQ